MANAFTNVFFWAAVSDCALMINFFDQLGLMPQVMVDCSGCLFFWLMVLNCMDGLSSKCSCIGPDNPRSLSSLAMLGVLRA